MRIFQSLIFLFTFFIFCAESGSAQQAPADFQIVFKFGFTRNVEEQTTFSSKENTLIVHGVDTVMTLPLTFTKDEMNQVYGELLKINFSGYPAKYIYQHPDTEQAYMMRPCNGYSLTTTADKKTQTVEWNSCISSKTKDPKHVYLMELDRFIERLIWSKRPLKDYHPGKMKY